MIVFGKPIDFSDFCRTCSKTHCFFFVFWGPLGAPAEISRGGVTTGGSTTGSIHDPADPRPDRL